MLQSTIYSCWQQLCLTDNQPFHSLAGCPPFPAANSQPFCLTASSPPFPDVANQKIHPTSDSPSYPTARNSSQHPPATTPAHQHTANSPPYPVIIMLYQPPAVVNPPQRLPKNGHSYHPTPLLGVGNTGVTGSRFQAQSGLLMGNYSNSNTVTVQEIKNYVKTTVLKYWPTYW